MPNLFRDLPAGPLAKEIIERLLDRPGLRVQRIVSTGQASPPDFWYDQSEHEWVVLLQGEADVTVEATNGIDTVRLAPGDWLELPAHRRHRVEATCADPPTVWLALFWPADAS